MRTPLAAAFVALLSLGAASASAAPGVALRWDQCYGDGGPINRSFACDTNSGSDVLIGSFELAQDGPPLANGLRAALVLAAASPTLPPWWEYRNVGSCRISSLTPSVIIPATAQNCVDWASGQATAGIGSYAVGITGPNTAGIEIMEAVFPLFEDLFAAQEYFAFKLTINHAKTLGTGACAGCSVPVCIVLREIKVLSQVLGEERLLTAPMNGTDAFYSTWQGGGSPTTTNGTGCPAATPTRRGTWGAVKALYR